MNDEKKPIAINVCDVPGKTTSVYPEPFQNKVAGREKRALGNVFSINNFGVNLTRLHPGAQSSLLHRHSKQEEFVYILEGEATLVTEEGERLLTQGMCAGFVPSGPAHYLVNKSDKDVVYLEVGDRTSEDSSTYPQDDLVATLDEKGQWVFTHKDGTPY